MNAVFSGEPVEQQQPTNPRDMGLLGLSQMPGVWRGRNSQRVQRQNEEMSRGAETDTCRTREPAVTDKPLWWLGVPGRQPCIPQFSALLSPAAATCYRQDEIINPLPIGERSTAMSPSVCLSANLSKTRGLAVASIARDDPSPLPGMHRDHNALPSQTDRQTDRRTLTS